MRRVQRRIDDARLETTRRNDGKRSWLGSLLAQGPSHGLYASEADAERRAGVAGAAGGGGRPCRLGAKGLGGAVLDAPGRLRGMALDDLLFLARMLGDGWRRLAAPLTLDDLPRRADQRADAGAVILELLQELGGNQRLLRPVPDLREIALEPARRRGLQVARIGHRRQTAD